MKEFLAREPFTFIIQAIICFCVFCLFLAVFIDFALYSGNGGVLKEKKSVVETGTMTLFFLGFLILLQKGVWVIPAGAGGVKELLMLMGTGMVAAGCAANIYGRFNLGRNWANQIRIYQGHTLVQTGMYGIVRHPLYASIILMFYGACLAYRNLAGIIAVSAVFVPFMAYRARQEEKLLIQKFPRYEQYRQRTGMFFPKIKIRLKRG